MSLNVEGRHPATQHLAPFFGSAHIAEGALAEVAEQCRDFAQKMIDTLSDGPELSAGLRKLLEAKDCFVRAALLDLDHAAAPNIPDKVDQAQAVANSAGGSDA